MSPLRFTTIRLGVVAIDLPGRRIDLDVRILLGSDGRYRLLLGLDLSEPLPSLEEAVRRVEQGKAVHPDVSRVVRWRPDLVPLPGEAPCPICAAPSTSSSRYPKRLCPACIKEATDADGRAVGFLNTGPNGVLEGRYADDGTPYASETCFVRGIRCLAAEHHFGGVVIQPADA